MIYTLAPFSVPVFLVDVKWQNKDILKNFVAELDTKDTEFSQRKNLENNKDFDSLKSLIIKVMKEVTNELGYEVQNFEIVSMWANGYSDNEKIHPHTHPNSWFSGVYYPEGCDSGPIRFMSPFVQTMSIRPSIKRETPFNTELVEYRIKNESILLFPSWLMHYTQPATEPKTSIAFNIWPRGLLEIDDISKVIV